MKWSEDGSLDFLLLITHAVVCKPFICIPIHLHVWLDICLAIYDTINYFEVILRFLTLQASYIGETVSPYQSHKFLLQLGSMLHTGGHTSRI